MAGKSDIEAGKAYITLLLKDASFSKSLTAAGQKLKSFGHGVSIMGAAIAGAGAAITAPILAAVHGVTEYGTQLQVMSERTGLAVESLAELRYAAEQTGGTLEDVEKALLKAGKSGLDPKRFDEIAAKLVAIEDPGKRLQETFKIFGRGAGAIIPMLEKLPQLRKEARDLGLVMDTKTAVAAHKLHNSFNLLGRIVGGVKGAIGSALIPTVQSAVTQIQNIAMSVREWVRAHKELFVSAFKVGVVLTAIGTAIATLGGVISAAGFALIGINGALGLMAGLFGALISPIGLTVAAVAGLATWFATSTTWGRQMVTSLAGWFGELKDIAVEAFQGISDALASGDLALATKISLAGVKLEHLNATKEIRTRWRNLGDGLVSDTANIVERMSSIWNEFFTHLKDMMSPGTRGGLVGGLAAALGMDPKQMDAAVQGAMGGMEGGMKAGAEGLNGAIKGALGGAFGGLDAGTFGGERADVLKEINDAKAELAKLRKQAAAQKHELKAGPGFDPANVPSAEALKNKMFSTFSVAAAVAGGGSVDTPETKELREQRHIHLMALKELMALRGEFKQRWGLT